VQASWFGAGQTRLLTADCQASGNSLVCSWFDGGQGSLPLAPVEQHRFYAWADPYDINPRDGVVGTVHESNEDNNYSRRVLVPLTSAQSDAASQNEPRPASQPGPQPTPTTVP
jgi:hypothetical protein